MEKLKQNITPKDIYNYCINQPTTQEPFTIFYVRRIIDGKEYEMKSQKFESKDETYCISLLESIMDLEDFTGWPFGDKIPNKK